MESLDEHDVYRFREGRVVGDDTGGAVKDVILVGLQSLVEGEKTPLTEYNEAVQRLQRRRRMMSVAEQAKTRSVVLGPDTPKIPTPESPMDVQVATEEIVYGAQHNAEEEGGMLVNLEDEEDEAPTEIERILDELAEGIQEPTLLRMCEEDVAFDMDEVVVDIPEDEELSDDDDNSDESSG